MNRIVYNTESPEETITAAEQFAKQLNPGDCVLYTGEMGAGKTHFTKGIAKGFGYTDHVTSPTFAIVNEYNCRPPVFHFDLFRLGDIDDLYAVGFFDYLRRDGVICVEWSENIPDLADELDSVWFADIRKTGENSRTITIEKRDG
ncbi:MAG: tRNA (adenosine(37)-N6)-threonylcarbamoyltransferase complex ATPase subunit type 1 TsaE [Ruminiclostridium sp.]|nr:tRNA (adenosine(37)-N6)-threonylcarbamoyltransferase complex ATPase subunit type 1 TsaE [Ruminiclostridium sp.]